MSDSSVPAAHSSPTTSSSNLAGINANNEREQISKGTTFESLLSPEDIADSRRDQTTADIAGQIADIRGTELPPELAAEWDRLVSGVSYEDLTLTATSRGVDNGWEAVLFVLMSRFATGRLQQNVTLPVVNQLQAENSLVHSFNFATAGSVTQSGSGVQPSPSLHYAQATTNHGLFFSHMSRHMDVHMQARVAGLSRYERVAATLLPPRENLVLVAGGERKQVYVRNYFAPQDAIEQLRQFIAQSASALSGAEVYINGNYEGEM